MSSELHSRIERGLSSLSERIKGLTGAGLNDAAKWLEPFAARLLNAAYGWNLALCVPTRKVIDLTDEAAAVAVQVSVQESFEKIKHTVAMLADGSLARFQTVVVFFLHHVKHRNDHGLRLINIPTLLADLMGKDLCVLEKVADVVELEVSGCDQTHHEQQRETLSITRATFDAVQQLVAKFGSAGPEAVPSPIATSTPEQRMAYYLASCVFAFRAYEELGIDNFRHAEDKAPDIWDIFVPPGCAEKPITPEEMEAAQSADPPQNPARDLLPLLADEKVRRHVLLGDPGMGKSTLIQRLIAGLADGRPTPGAEGLQDSLPIPFILRDLVPLMPADVSTWSWDTLCRTLHSEYRRNDQAQPLCLAWANFRYFRAELLSHPRAFFLLDGFDEIGDLTKRTAIRDAIWEGFRAHPEARWVITSRIVGYDLAKVHYDSFFINSEESHELPSELLAEMPEPFKSVFHRSKYVASPRVRWGNLSHLCNVSATTKRDTGELLSTTWSIFPAERHYLTPFDNTKQEAFTRNWFRARNPNAPSPSLLQEIRQRGHDGIRVIARVPNLLCYMAMLKRSGKPLPDGRAVLYTEIVRAYLHGIDRAYQLSQKDHGHACPFTVKDTWHLLAVLAAEMQRQRTGDRSGAFQAPSLSDSDAPATGDGNITILESEVHTLLIPVIQRLQPAADAPALLREFLGHIARRSGLLIPRGTSPGGILYGFTHLSFLEYFAACYLNEQLTEAESRLVAAIRRTFDPDKWNREHPPGPLGVTPACLEQWAAHPLWTETLFFLAELRAENPDALDILFQDLFPTLYGSRMDEPVPILGKDSDPSQALIPYQAVVLAVRLLGNQILPISPETTEAIYTRLWDAYLAWNIPALAKHPWPTDSLLFGLNSDIKTAVQGFRKAATRYGHITSLCLDHCDCIYSPEFLRDLWPNLVELSLIGCKNLCATSGLPQNLKYLYLNDCTALQIVSDLPNSLDELWLKGCSNLISINYPSGLKFVDLGGCLKLEQLGKLPPTLERLFLHRCISLKRVTNLPASLGWLHLHDCTNLTEIGRLPDSLEWLFLNGCIGLQALGVMPKGLANLALHGCTGLSLDELSRLRAWANSQQPPCEIYGI